MPISHAPTRCAERQRGRAQSQIRSIQKSSTHDIASMKDMYGQIVLELKFLEPREMNILKRMDFNNKGA